MKKCFVFCMIFLITVLNTKLTHCSDTRNNHNSAPSSPTLATEHIATINALKKQLQDRDREIEFLRWDQDRGKDNYIEFLHRKLYKTEKKLRDSEKSYEIATGTINDLLRKAEDKKKNYQSLLTQLTLLAEENKTLKQHFQNMVCDQPDHKSSVQ